MTSWGSEWTIGCTEPNVVDSPAGHRYKEHMSDRQPRIVTVFRSRLREDAEANGYPALAAEMGERAASMPGFVEYKTFSASDGERVTIAVFDSAEHQKAWREDPAHREAQQRGRRDLYASYSISVCEEVSQRTFPR